jgi:hypothetical protein
MLMDSVPYEDHGPFRVYQTAHNNLNVWFHPDLTVKMLSEFGSSLIERYHTEGIPITWENNNIVGFFCACFHLVENRKNLTAYLKSQGFTLTEFIFLLRDKPVNMLTVPKARWLEFRNTRMELTSISINVMIGHGSAISLKHIKTHLDSKVINTCGYTGTYKNTHEIFNTHIYYFVPARNTLLNDSTIPPHHRNFICPNCSTILKNYTQLVEIIERDVLIRYKCAHCMGRELREQVQEPGPGSFLKKLVYPLVKSVPHKILNYTADPMRYAEGFLLGKNEIQQRVRSRDVTCYLGVEFEVTFPTISSSDRLSIFYKDVIESLNNTAILKYDSSVGFTENREPIPNVMGFEITSVPMTFKKQREVWKPFFEKFGSKLLVDKHPSGIHVHVSKNAFTNFNRQKLHYFMNREVNREFMLLISERKEEHFTKWCRTNYVKLDRRTGRNSQHDSNGNITKYRVVYTRPYTEEFRLFNAVKKYELFMKNLEFIMAVKQFTEEQSMRLLDYRSFVEWVGQRGFTYPNLCDFLFGKGLINRKGEVQISKSSVDKMINMEAERYAHLKNKLKKKTASPYRSPEYVRDYFPERDPSLTIASTSPFRETVREFYTTPLTTTLRRG